MRPHIAGVGGRLILKQVVHCVFAWPQQKSGPTEVNENNGVVPLSPEVCAGPVKENGTAKGEKCDRKTQTSVHL